MLRPTAIPAAEEEEEGYEDAADDDNVTNPPPPVVALWTSRIASHVESENPSKSPVAAVAGTRSIQHALIRYSVSIIYMHLRCKAR